MAHTPYLLFALGPHYGNYNAMASVAIQTLSIVLALCLGKLHCVSERATVVVSFIFCLFLNYFFVCMRLCKSLPCGCRYLRKPEGLQVAYDLSDVVLGTKLGSSGREASFLNG